MIPQVENIRMAQCPKWLIQKFDTHIVVKHDDKGTAARVNRFSSEATPGKYVFNFSGINPLKLPKAVQGNINYWMEQHCKAAKQGIWDCEAWEGYGNTPVVL
jgi:hypothetical protein